MLQILARHWASRKIWSTKFPLRGGGGKPYPASGLLIKTDKPYFGKITTGNFISLIKIVVFEWDKISIT